MDAGAGGVGRQCLTRKCAMSVKILFRNAYAALNEAMCAALITGKITARYVSLKRKRLAQTVVITVQVHNT